MPHLLSNLHSNHIGSVGQHVAKVAAAMGMKVLSTRGSSSRADLEALLRGSDVVSVHCPLTERTRGLIGREELALMRPGAVHTGMPLAAQVSTAMLL